MVIDLYDATIGLDGYARVTQKGCDSAHWVEQE
jgi:hypothetical protein